MPPSNTTYNRNYMARKLWIIPGLFLCMLSAQCGKRVAHHPVPAFYYWKTNLKIGEGEQKLLRSTGAQTLYLRLFDIDWDQAKQQAMPKGILQAAAIRDSSLAYIPVVYITQPCLLQLQQEDIPALAAGMNKLIGSLCRQYALHPSEIQIDCDWTQHTAGLYFSLLRQLKEQSCFRSAQLSCTIRLHQVKYSSTSGIPPVDKGMLMVYNMGNLTRYGSQNSILQPAEARRYLKNIGLYPLPLDIALPLYHWAALFENRRFKGIVYNIGLDDLPASLIAQQEGHLYRILRDTAAHGYTFKKDQEIRFEQPDLHDLSNVASFIAPRLKDTSFRLAFFHLDSRSVQPYTEADLNHIIHLFR